MDQEKTIYENDETKLDINKTIREDIKNTEDSSEKNDIQLKSFREFKILQEFSAHGGEADTYLIESGNEKRFLKLYRKGLAPKEDVLKKLYDLSRKLPEHVVFVYDYGYDEKTQRYYEILEYIEFGSLSAFVHQKGLIGNKEFVKDMIKELADGLKALHDNRIIHRDIKTSNILVRRDNPLNLVLTDFGISTLSEEEVSKVFSNVKGTYSYTAPESFSGYFGKEVDWWALGIIVIEMLTGRNPFSGLALQVIMNQIITQEVAIPDVNDDFKLLLMGLLTKDPKKRWGYKEVNRWLSGDRNIEVYYGNYLEKNKTNTLEWLKLGFTQQGAETWMKVINDPEKAYKWKEAGFTPTEAKSWIDYGLEDSSIVTKWIEAGFNKPEEIRFYEDKGLSVNFAKKLHNAQFDFEDIVYITEKLGLSINDLKQLIDKGFDKNEILLWFSLPIDKNIDSIIQLKNDGIIPVVLDEFIKQGIELNEAIQWIKAGFTVQEAVNWKNNGFNLEDAISNRIKENSEKSLKQLKENLDAILGYLLLYLATFLGAETILSKYATYILLVSIISFILVIIFYVEVFKMLSKLTNNPVFYKNAVKKPFIGFFIILLISLFYAKTFSGAYLISIIYPIIMLMLTMRKIDKYLNTKIFTRIGIVLILSLFTPLATGTGPFLIIMIIIAIILLGMMANYIDQTFDYIQVKINNKD